MSALKVARATATSRSSRYGATRMADDVITDPDPGPLPTEDASPVDQEENKEEELTTSTTSSSSSSTISLTTRAHGRHHICVDVPDTQTLRRPRGDLLPEDTVSRVPLLYGHHRYVPSYQSWHLADADNIVEIPLHDDVDYIVRAGELDREGEEESSRVWLTRIVCGMCTVGGVVGLIVAIVFYLKVA